MSSKNKDQITVPVVLTQGVLAKMIEESDINLKPEVSTEALNRILERKVDQCIDSHIKTTAWSTNLESMVAITVTRELNRLLENPDFVDSLQSQIGKIIVSKLNESLKASVRGK